MKNGTGVLGTGRPAKAKRLRATFNYLGYFQAVDGDTAPDYSCVMSKEQLAQEIMALPLAEKVSLAQVLWETIDEGLLSAHVEDAGQIVAEAQLRDAELSSGAVAGRSHEQVMEAVRRALECP